MPQVSVNEADLYWEERGAGAPLLFIHGMCGNANVWDGQVQRLSHRFHCIAYDRRGHTRSPLGSISERSVELHADDAALLIEALGIAPCFLVASSGGARIGVDMLRRYPDLLRGAVLSEPPLFGLDPEGARVVMAELRPLLERAMNGGGPRSAVDAFFAYMCPGLWATLDDQAREPYRANHVELFGDLQMPPYQITTDDLRNIRVPSLIVTGSESHPLLRHVASLLAENIPTAELIELEGSGHVTYAEKPEEFARAATEFVQRLANAA